LQLKQKEQRLLNIVLAIQKAISNRMLSTIKPHTVGKSKAIRLAVCNPDCRRKGRKPTAEA
jgi:hypothetical protein